MNIQTLLKDQMRKNIPDLRAGQVIRVYEKIKEDASSKDSGQAKERIQVFEGLVISVKHGKGLNGMFTVRKIATGGIGVERTFPIHMPSIQKIEILRQEKVRRAKLYYVRGQINKKTKKRKTKLKNLIFDMDGETQADSDSKKEKIEDKKIEKTEKEIEKVSKKEIKKQIQKVSGKKDMIKEKIEDKLSASKKVIKEESKIVELKEKKPESNKTLSEEKSASIKQRDKQVSQKKKSLFSKFLKK